MKRTKMSPDVALANIWNTKLAIFMFSKQPWDLLSWSDQDIQKQKSWSIKARLKNKKWKRQWKDRCRKKKIIKFALFSPSRSSSIWRYGQNCRVLTEWRLIHNSSLKPQSLCCPKIDSYVFMRLKFTSLNSIFL